MSRVLTDLLGSHDPSFRLGLAELERLAGAPRVDIRLGVEITTGVSKQLKQLGLDPANTTGPELFRALEQRLTADEATIRQALGVKQNALPVELLTAVQRFLTRETADKKVFALKPTAMRAVLKKLKPKATMKALGYRSMDSMFKHESILQLLVATELAESAEWRQARREASSKFQPKDFELRAVQYVLPTGKHWPELARDYTEKHRHNILKNVEMGGVVILPLDVDLPALALVSIVLGLQAFEVIRAESAYLKLHHVEPSFSSIFQESVDREPVTGFTMAGRMVPWRTVHWFYGSGHAPYYPDIFDPHLQPDDFARHDIYTSLESLQPGLGFWRSGDMLGLRGVADAAPVSFNLLDVALGICNRLEYNARFAYHMQAALWRELATRYMGFGRLHAMLEESLGSQLTSLEPVFEDIEEQG